MLDTSSRLLRLLGLLQSRREWAGRDLAHRLDIDVRTVRRDVDRLRSLGYRVAASAGPGGGYQLGAGNSMPPLLLDDDEAVAVALGLLTSALGAVSGLEEASLQAFGKLQQLVPQRLRGRIEALGRATTALTPAAGATVSGAQLASLATACRDAVVVRFWYRSREGEPSERSVEPHRLVCTGRRWYLVAWDLQRTDWRTFRVDRVERLAVTASHFLARPLPRQLPEFVADAITSAPYRFQAHVRFFAPISEVSERVSPTAGRLVAETATSCLLTTGSGSLDELALYVALKGFDFEVLEPPELVSHLEALGRRCQRAAAGRRRRSPRTR